MTIPTPEFTAATIPAIVEREGLHPRCATWSPARVLAGLGLPGFGGKFARQALAKMDAWGLNAHEACLGGPSARRKLDALEMAS